MASQTLLVILALAFLGGCGGGEEDQTATRAPESSAPEGRTQGSSEGDEGSTTAIPVPEGAEELSPKAAAYYAARLKENFPKPKPAPKAKQVSSKAIAEGKRVCKAATPIEIAERYESDADLDPEQEELLAELSRYESEAVKDPNFVAGQIGAMVYEATLDERRADYGFQGCVFALARALGAGIRE